MKRAAFAVWLVLLLLAWRGYIALGPIEALVLLAVLVIVPLGLSLDPLPAWQKYMLPLAGAPVIVSFYLPPGRPAAALASVWILATLAIAAPELLRLRHIFDSTALLCRVASRLFLPVAGFWLVVSRAGIRPIFFDEPIVLLTAIHFHYAGFAAVAYAGAAETLLGRRRFYRWAVAAIVAGPPLVAAGFLLNLWLKVVAAGLTAVSLTILAAMVAGAVRQIPDRLARALLTVSASAVVAAMLLECVYAAGEVANAEWIRISEMAWTHGILNGVGFALRGLVGWQRASRLY